MSRRSIAPRPTTKTGDENFSGPSVAPGETHPDPSLIQNTASVQPRKKVTNACQGCQKRRVRCDGSQPCATCQRTHSECLYVRELDGRSIKRKYHDVQRDQELLESLLQTIRYTHDEDVAQIVALIRSDATMDEIKACITQQLNDIKSTGREQSPEFKQFRSSLDALHNDSEEEERSSKRPDLLEIQRLADQPVHRVPAAPWTTITADDDLVSNLISVWSTWDKGWNDPIDEDLFVRDMQAGSLDCTFCSPFLVNSLLAWACPYSDYKEARTSRGSISPLMLAFIAEAQRLLEEVEYKGLPLTTIQGLLSLYAAMNVAGKDTTGYKYLLQGLGLVGDLMQAHVPTKLPSDSQIAKDLSVCIDRTVWSTFISTTGHFMSMMKPQSMRPPHRARPQYDRDDTRSRVWRPYPYRDVTIPSYRNELFDFGCDLAIIQAQLSRVLFDVAEQSTGRHLAGKVVEIHQELLQLLDRLSPELHIRPGCCPGIFYLHVKIQWVQLRMFLTLRQGGKEPLTDTMQMARTRCIDAALEIARICKFYMQTWGPPALGIAVCHPIYIATSVLVEEQELDRYASHITDMCVALRAASRRWPLIMGVLRLLQLEAREKGWKLPSDTDKLFQEFEGVAWRQRDLRRFVTLHPAAEATKSNNFTGDEIDVGIALERLDKIDLDDSIQRVSD